MQHGHSSGSPTPSSLYLGSPSITVLPDGSYLASNDNFGSGVPVKTQIYRSTDRGVTWTARSEVTAFWSNLFVHSGAVYLLGTSEEYGNLVIRRSSDSGLTWTTPSSATTGLLRSGQYHTAPMPVVIHNGRIWRAFEDIGAGNGWPRHFRAFLMSVPVGADLLNAANWTFTASLTSQNTWMSGKFNGWLEGNVVLTPEGRLVDVLRADIDAGTPEKAAIIDFGSTGASGSFNPAGTPGTNPADRSGFVDFPGGAKKFSIRRDPDDGNLTRVPFTISFWLRTAPGDTTYRVPLSKLATGDFNGYLFGVNSAGLPGKASFVATSAAKQLASSVVVNDGLWHHLAVTLVPGQDMILYVDGIEQARTAAPVIVKTPAPLRFGAQTVGTAAEPKFAGWLDEIQIHHTALSRAEIDAMVLDPDRMSTAGESFTPGMRMEATRNEVNWRAVPGRSYQVLRSITLDNDWSSRGIVTATGPIAGFVETAPPARAFYLIDLVR